VRQPRVSELTRNAREGTLGRALQSRSRARCNLRRLTYSRTLLTVLRDELLGAGPAAVSRSLALSVTARMSAVWSTFTHAVTQKLPYDTPRSGSQNCRCSQKCRLEYASGDAYSNLHTARKDDRASQLSFFHHFSLPL